jgi:DNA-binding transcriptional LysR family regulator
MRRTDTYKEIELRQLRSFTLAAAQGNFSSAAGVLGLSVPAVWEQVRSLERILGATLLLRRGRTLELTMDGKILLELIQPHVSGLDSLVKLFRARQTEQARQLGVASVQYILANLLPPPVQEFMQQYPQTQIKLFPDPRSAEVVRMIERGEADVGLVTCNADEPVSSHLEYEHLSELKYMLLTGDRHPLARMKQVKPGDLVQHPVITMPMPSPNRKALDRILRRHNLLDRLRIAMENTSVDIIQKYVVAGAGIALLYVWPKAGRTVPGLHVRHFDRGIEPLSVAVVTRKFAHLAEHVQKFQEILRRHFGNETSTDD